MSERTLVNYVLRGMKGRWRVPVKHADQFTEGVADLSGHLPRAGTVWIEAKALAAFPKRWSTTVKVGITPMQKRFLLGRHGWLFVRVGREYFLFDSKAAQFIDTPQITETSFRFRAKAHWCRKVDWLEFEELLRVNHRTS